MTLKEWLDNVWNTAPVSNAIKKARWYYPMNLSHREEDKK